MQMAQPCKLFGSRSHMETNLQQAFLCSRFASCNKSFYKLYFTNQSLQRKQHMAQLFNSVQSKINFWKFL
jgi:hypothetical protein